MPLTLQDLDPVDARLCLGVERFITGELGLAFANQRWLLAVSGGADSMALLHILHVLRPRLSVELHVMALNHALRPHSGAEAEGVRELCDALGIACTVRRLAVAECAAARGLGLEEAGRALRYAALEEERKRLGAAWIVTGHQLEDLGEDVLLRLLRGTGWPGLGGMPAVDAGRQLLRPLLLTPAGALRAFLRRCGIGWFEDESNNDRNFRRNRVRHALWPLLLEESPRLAEHIAHLWRIARADEAYWDARLESMLPEGEGAVTLEGAVLRGLEQAARLRLYMRAVSRLRREHGRGQSRAETLFALDAAWREGRGATRFQFPGGIRAEVRRSGVSFFLEEDGSDL
ncbi:MAG: tRNA lysidine(34) synthetase TilS [Deltaproteobacteria bacterium]|jgi:tRNA(Ile)-lysidine synthase|nr:tRNA lysidine(34) synthetase TilS [Deltaproteobacteria bacterium]